jgi:hypothetical protein
MPVRLLRRLLAPELSEEAVSGNTEALAVYTTGILLAYKNNTPASTMPASTISNFSFPSRLTIFRVNSIVVKSYSILIDTS